MSNALNVSPAVMINRLADRSGASLNTQLAKVAELRMSLQTAVANAEHQEALTSPTGEAEPIVVDSGAVVDKLI